MESDSLQLFSDVRSSQLLCAGLGIEYPRVRLEGDALKIAFEVVEEVIEIGPKPVIPSKPVKTVF